MPATEIRVTGFARCSRAALLQGTALRAAALVVLSSPALAQIAPGAHPSGGVVVGGQAGIAQAGSNTVVTQASQRAAINWQSFDVGSRASVTFRQPGSSAIALNRVIGPNPSEIAGRITANGQVVIVNQSGVVFDQGAQVDTAGLVVSASGITNQHFMAGQMVFDQAPHPGALVANNGTITIRQAGLAALVAPSVSNAGLIRAQLGRVVLAGAATYTLDLYGDGLLSLNVTGQVAEATLGGRTVPALVTNSGLILADGGTVLLTAQAADGLIRTLVEAGGTIQTHSLGARTGRVLAQGIGGSVEIEGTMDARGLAAGTTGGQVVADATGDVIVGPAARIDVSGAAGGGLIVLGTTAARARGGPHTASALTARSTTVAAGAILSADATTRGDGGRITVLSAGETSMAGAISLLGAAGGGDGGAAEISGATVFLPGHVDAGATAGRIGSLLIDPVSMVVIAGPDAASPAGTVTFGHLMAMNADVTLAADQLVDFAFTATPPMGSSNTLNLGTHGLTVTAGKSGMGSIAGTIDIDGGVTIDAGAVSMTSTGGVIAFDTNTGVALGLGAASTAHAALSGSTVVLTGDAGLTLAGAAIMGTTSLTLAASAGGIIGTGVLTSPTLAASASTGITLSGANDLNALGTVSTTTGDIHLVDQQTLTTNGAITASAGTVSLATLGLDIGNSITGSVSVSLSANGGDITEGAAGLIKTPLLSASATQGAGEVTGKVDLSGANLIGTVTQVTTDGDIHIVNDQSLTVAGLTTNSGNVNLSSAGLTLTGTVLADGNVTLTDATGDVIESGAGLINASLLNGTITLGKATLGGDNLVSTVDQFTAHGDVLFNDTQPLGVGGLTSSGNVTLSATSLGLTGTVLASTGTVSLTSTGGNIAESGAGMIHATSLTGSASGGGTVPASADLRGGNLVGTLSAFATDGNLQLVDTQALLVNGDATGAGTLVSLAAPGISVASATGTVHGGGLVTLQAGTFDLAGTVTTPLTGTVAIDLSAPAGMATPGTLAVGGTADSFGGNGLAHVATGTLLLGSLDGVAASGDVAGITVAGALDLTGVATTLGLFTTDTGTVSVPGVLKVGTVFGSSGDFTLGGANAIGTLGTTGAMTLDVSDTGDLTVSGTVQGTQTATVATTGTLTVAGSVTGVATALSGSNLAIGGTATGSTSLTLTASTGTISETGSLSTGLLTGQSLGTTTLTGSNSITGIGGFTAGGFTLTNAPDITLFGSLNAASGVSVTDTGSLTVAVGLGSITGSVTSFDAASIDVLGSVDAATSLSLMATTGSIAVTGGINTGLLTGTAGTSAQIGGTTSVTDLGSFGASGFSLTQTGALHVTGAVTGGAQASIGSSGLLTVSGGGSVGADATSLSGAQLAIAGAVTGSNTLTLTATTGTISAPGSLTTALLTGSATGSATLNGSNTITGLGTFSAASLTLLTTPDLQVSGAVDGGNVLAITDTGTLTVAAAGSLTGSATTLMADAVLIPGQVSAGGSLSIKAGSGAVTASGDLSAGTLSVSAPMGAVSLTGTNSISTLSASGAGQGFTLDDGGTLTVAGSVTAGTGLVPAILKLTAPTLTLLSAGSLTSTGTVALGSDDLTLHGPITTPITGLIAVDELTGHTLSILAAGLGTFTTGELALGSLNGTSPSGQVTDIVLMGDLDLGSHASTLGLFTTSTGTVTSTGGVGAGTLVGSAGNVTLTGSANAVSQIGSFSAASLVFSQSGALDVSGAVNGGAVATLGSGGLLKVDGSVTAAATSLTGTSVMLPGAVTGSTSLTLTATTGDITSAGSLTTALLTGQSLGTTTLTGSNSITGIGGFTAQGFTLTNAPDITLFGSLSASSGVSVTDTGTLTVAVTLGSITGSVTSFDAAAIDILGSVNAATSLSLIANTGTIAVTGGITTGLLTGMAAGSAQIGGATDVTDLGSFGASGFSLAQTGALQVTDAVTGGARASIGSSGLLTVGGGGSVSGDATSLSGAKLALAGAVTGSNTLTLTATTGTISAPGSLTTALLTGSAAGSATLNGSNAITGLGTFSAAGLTLLDTPDLRVTGNASGGATLSVTDTGTLTVAAAGSLAGSATTLAAAAIVIDGAVTAPTSLSLTSTVGAITETGSITTGLLSGSAATSATLTGTNSITVLGPFRADAFSLTQTGDLDVTGAVGGGTLAAIAADGLLTIDGSVASRATSLSGANLAIPGTAIGSATLTLTATSGTIAAPGTLTTALLTGSATGSTSLSGSNAITGLGSFTASGFLLDDMTDLGVSAAVDGGAALTIVDAGSLTVGGSLAGSVTHLTASSIGIAGSVSAPTSLSLTSTTGSIAETGSLSTGLLTGSAATGASFSGAGSVTHLGSFSATGFAFSQTGALDVTGAVDGGALASIASTAGLLTIDGSVSAERTSLDGAGLAIPGSVTGSTALTLTAAAGTISETGSLDTALLTGSAAGSASLTGTNSITTLGGFTSSGFGLTDTPDLAVTGGVDGGSTVTIVDTGVLTIAAKGSVSGSATALKAAGLVVPGTITAPSSLSLTATAGGITETGTLDTALLTGSATGSASFAGTDSIARLGTFTSHGLALVQAGALDVSGTVGGGTLASIASTGGPITVAGSVSAGTTSLTGTSLSIPGSATGTAKLTLTATGGTITESGSLATALLSGSATGSAALTGSNAVNSLGSFTAFGLVLDDTPDLTVIGAVNGHAAVSVIDSGTLTIAAPGSIAGSVTALAAAAIGIAGGITAPTSLSLIATAGGIGETGSITTGVLSASAVTSISLLGTNNVGALGTISANGFAYSQAGDLDVTGTIDGGSSASIASGGVLTIDGSVTAAATSLTGANLAIPGTAIGSSTLTLTATSGTISAPGTLDTALLTGSAVGSATLSGSNSLTSLGSFTAHGLTLADTPDLTVTGRVNGTAAVVLTDAGTLTVAASGSVNGLVGGLTAAAIVIDGAVTAPTSLSLTATTGAIAETGSLSTGLLTGSAATTASLSGNDAITDLGDFTAQGFGLVQAGDLAVTGAIGGGPLATIASGGALTVDGSVTAVATALTGASLAIPGAATGSATLTLTATAGMISETGALTTALLTGSATQGASLAGSNAVTALGGFTADGLTLIDTPDLQVVGTVDGTSAVAIADTGTLTVAAAGSLAGSVTSLTAAAILIDGAVAAPTSLSLTSTVGAIAETGSLTTGLLTGQAATSASFAGSDDIAVLGNFTSDGFALVQTPDLDVTGAVSGGPLVSILVDGSLAVDGSVTAAATALQAGSLAIAGTATGSSSLTLTASTGGITATGALDTALLTGSAVGSAALTGTNDIAVIGDFAASGLTVADLPDLLVAGAVDGGPATIITDSGALTIGAGGSVAGVATTLTAAAIGVDGSIAAPGALSLSATGGDIAETGTVTAGTLTGSATGAASFTGGNGIATLGDFSATSFSLDDTQDLAVNGVVQATTGLAILDAGGLTVVGGIIAPVTSLTASSIDLPGNVTAAGSLALVATAGAITQSGTLTTAMLTGSATGSANLTGSNAVATLGGFSAAGFTLADAQALTVAGALTGGDSASITDASALTVAGSIDANATTLAAGTIDLPGAIAASSSLELTASAGGITQTGSIVTGLLSGSAIGSASLAGGGSAGTTFTNAIGTLGAFSSNGFVLDDQAALVVAGPLQGGPAISLDSAGAVSITGSIAGNATTIAGASIATSGFIDATDSLALASGGDIDSTGSVIIGMLTGSAAGSASFTGIGIVATLGDFTSSGFTLVDGNSLVVAGSLNGGSAVSISDMDGLAVTGAIQGAATSLTAPFIDIPGGIAADTLALTTVSGAITESGTIDAATLTGSAAGSASFSGSNTIGTLGNFAAAGFTLKDAPALVVSGSIDGASGVAITAGGLSVDAAASIAGDVTSLTANTIGIGGSVTAPTSLSLDATAGSIAVPGALSTPLLSVAATGSAALGGTNQVAELAGATTPAGFAMMDAGSLKISGTLSAAAGGVDLTTAGLDVTGRIAAADTVTLGTAGTITLSGNLTAPTILAGTKTDTPLLVDWNGGSVVTGSTFTATVVKPVFPKIDGSATGIYVFAHDFTQTGTTQISGETRVATVDIILSAPKGHVDFDTSLSAGLIAPTTQLFIDLNSGGTVSGHIVVAGLNVSYVEPAAPSLSDISGTIGGLGGQSAAGRAYILPLANANYRFNACAIQSVNCVLLSPVVVPIYNPTEDVSVETPHRRRDDDDLIIPNVGEEDF